MSTFGANWGDKIRDDPWLVLRLPLWNPVGFSWINISVTQSRSSMDPTAQTCLQRILSGNTGHHCHFILLCIWLLKALEIQLKMLLWCSSYCLGNSSQFPPQGSDRPTGSGFVDSMVEVPRAAAGQGLTFIGYQVNGQLSLRKSLCLKSNSLIIQTCFHHLIPWFSVTGFIEQWKCSYRYSDEFVL